MAGKKKYISPVCTETEAAPQTVFAGSTVSVDRIHRLNDMGGDVNRNEDYDIWNN